MTIAAVLTGCGATPVLEDGSLRRTADEYVAVYNDWDGARLTGLFAEAPEAEAYREHFAWMRARLGECGAPRPLWQEGLTKAGFSFPCEHGAIHQLFYLDAKGQLLRTVGGAANVPAEGAVAVALQTVLAAMPAVDSEARPWARPLRRDWVRARGRCELERTVVVAERGGAFELECEGGAATLKLWLGKDGEIESIKLWYAPQDRSGAHFEEPVG